MVDLKAELHYPFQQHNIRFMLASVFSQERMKSTRNYLFKLLTVVLQGISVRVGRCFNWKKKRIDKVLRTGTGGALWGVN